MRMLSKEMKPSCSYGIILSVDCSVDSVDSQHMRLKLVGVFLPESSLNIATQKCKRTGLHCSTHRHCAPVMGKSVLLFKPFHRVAPCGDGVEKMCTSPFLDSFSCPLKFVVERVHCCRYQSD
eukprot:GHVN01097074.1.p1 GENE.GHVN01097074.1~~GHVN01097074.1.p1  ORF type:complete len:122 (+),score=0.60 GHVN01097074.1:1269-1634(+)